MVAASLPCFFQVPLPAFPANFDSFLSLGHHAANLQLHIKKFTSCKEKKVKVTFTLEFQLMHNHHLFLFHVPCLLWSKIEKDHGCCRD